MSLPCPAIRLDLILTYSRIYPSATSLKSCPLYIYTIDRVMRSVSGSYAVHTMRWESNTIRLIYTNALLTGNPRTAALMKDMRRGKEGRKNVRYSLGFLLDGPKDIMYEVLGHLHPLDLHHLARTIKPFRTLLMSQDSSWLWILVFERNLSIPSCPPDLPSPLWAELLFGPFVCQSCGVLVEPNMTSRRRLCWGCECALFDTLYSEFFIHETTSSGVTISFSVEGINEPNPISRDDVQRIADLVYFAQSNGLDQLRTLKTSPATKDVAESILSHADICNEWAQKLEARRKTSTEMKDQGLALLLRRSTAMGYDCHDVVSLYYRHSFFEMFNLNVERPAKSIRRNWWRLKGSLKSALVPVARLRRHRIRSATVATSEYILTQLFIAYQSTISDGAPNAPRETEFTLYDPFFSVMDADRLLEMDGIENVFRLFLQQWPPRTTDELVSLCPMLAPTACHLIPMASPNAVTSIFTCKACVEEVGPSVPGKCLIGWDAARTHLSSHTTRPLHLFQVNERGCAAALALLRNLALDPLTTLPEDLDALDGGFICMECPESPEDKPLFLWRDYIHHFITMASDERHALPSWQALSPEEWAETTARTYGDESAGLVYGVRNGLSLLMKWASTLVYHD